MKKYIISAMLLLCSTCIFTACDDDRDSNPVIQQPTTFTLNTPAYAGSNIDLEGSSSINFTWSQPDYGYPAVVNYSLQISATGTFTVSQSEADADETGATVADYISSSEYTICSANLSAEELNKSLVQLCKWEEDNVPSTQTVYIRANAYLANSSNAQIYNITSNVVELTVSPYYVALKDAEPEMWYLIGSCIGDGAWSNSAEAIGTSIYPMSLVKDYEYDKKTGEGELTFTGWLTPDGFKLIKVPGSWDDQWGQGDAFGTFVMNDGGSGNIAVPAAGYYTITLNTKSDELTVVAADITPTVHESICITGDFNGWTDNAMTAVNSVVENNHIWSYVLDATGGDTTAKFKIAGSWDTNWGSDTFPYGFGVGNGANIAVTAGKYTVIFNDIDGSYVFVAAE